MRLSLSSAAGADLPLSALLEGCQRRGLAGLEPTVGDDHGHGHGVSAENAAECVRLAEASGVHIIGLLATGPLDDDVRHAVRLARALRAPLILRTAELPPAVLASVVKRSMQQEVRILLLHATDARTVSELRRSVDALPPGAAGLAWEVDPANDDPAEVPAVLQAAGTALQYVRLRGGGPESALQTGMGVGALMARLALARFAGPLVLTPSTPRYRLAWLAWLGRGRGWGCGSKQADDSLVGIR
jgi:hypothetical protein